MELSSDMTRMTSRRMNHFRRNGSVIYFGDALEHYSRFPSPVVIVADGPYGLSSFPGDPATAEDLGQWYEPHIEAWSKHSTPQTTLWFWNSEIGWATVHPVLAKHGWKYRSCHVWDKGASHVAGNANTKTLRKFPVVTEVCVQYVREAEFAVAGRSLSMQEWLRHEWQRSGLPFYEANRACGVKNAATRKYLTECHLWYYPPPEAFEKLVRFVNAHGDPKGRPYFSIDGRKPLNGSEWECFRAKFYCAYGVHNVWREPPVRGAERLKSGAKCIHMNQKPLRLLEQLIRASSDEGDVVWEPFGGLCSAAVASFMIGRKCRSCEIIKEYFLAARARLARATKRSNVEEAAS